MCYVDLDYRISIIDQATPNLPRPLPTRALTPSLVTRPFSPSSSSTLSLQSGLSSSARARHGHLSQPTDKTIPTQSVTLIAGLDYPAKWPNLIDVLPTPLFQPLPLPRRIQRQPQCPRNNTLHIRTDGFVHQDQHLPQLLHPTLSRPLSTVFHPLHPT